MIFLIYQWYNNFFCNRLEIYKEFITLLDHLYNQSISNPLTPTISSKVGSPSQNSSTVPVTPAKEIVRYNFFKLNYY